MLITMGLFDRGLRNERMSTPDDSSYSVPDPINPSQQQYPNMMTQIQGQLNIQREKDETFMRWHHDNTDILELLEFQLRGFERRFGEWHIPKDNKPTSNALMNERGIYDIMEICRTNFSKITNSTNLDMKEVNDMALFFEFSIIEALQSHYFEYGIKNPQDLNVIYTLLRNPHYAMLKQSFMNGTRQHIGDVMSYNEGFRNIDRDVLLANQGSMPRKKFMGLF
jgi:hypothetical protein